MRKDKKEYQVWLEKEKEEAEESLSKAEEIVNFVSCKTKKVK